MNQAPDGLHNNEVKAELHALREKIAELDARLNSVGPDAPSPRGRVFSRILTYRWPLVTGLLVLAIGAVAQNSNPPLVIDPNGTVRISTLEVAGKNVAQALAPIGGVVAYAGPIDDQHRLPPGWMLCDGQALKSSEYGELFAAIGTANGDGRDVSNNKVADFNLPDYRGYFLRGADSNSARDSGQRTDPKPGIEVKANAAGRVGSVEMDEIHRHNHGYVNTFGQVAQSDHAGADESRPKNVSVNWLIRAK